MKRKKSKLRHRYGHASSYRMLELDRLLASAFQTGDNVGDWRGEHEGSRLWIGDPSGSRSHMYEGSVVKNGHGFEFRSKTFAGLKRQLLKHFRSAA